MKALGFIAAAMLFAVAAFSAPPVRAAQPCDSCYANYEACVAAGGTRAGCWVCNNNQCRPPTANLQGPSLSVSIEPVKRPEKDFVVAALIR